MHAVALAMIALLLGSGCAPTHHRAQAYRFDAVASRALEQRASEACQQAGEPAGKPGEPFRTDGCSLWPDGTVTGEMWQDCCVEHDIDYWCGGTREMREAADRELQRCVADQYAPWLGALMRWGVIGGGHPWVPAYWRWGYGHAYPASYTEPGD